MTKVAIEIEPGMHHGLLNALASLPESYALAEDADTIALHGDASWALRAIEEISSGRRAVLVVDPGPADLTDLSRLAELARSAAVPLVAIRGWGSNAAVQSFRTFAAAVRSGDVLCIESVAVDGPETSVVALAMAQLDLIATAFESRIEIEDVIGSERGWVATCRIFLGDTDVLTTCAAARVEGCEPIATARAFLSEARLALTVPDGRVARPGTASYGDTSGETTAPFVFESSYRSALRAFADRRDGSSDAIEDLLRLSSTIDGARSIEQAVANESTT